MHPSLMKARVFATLALIILTFSFTLPMIGFHGALNKISEGKGEEVTSLKGLCIANKNPKIKAAKIQGTLIFSITLPTKSTKKKAIAKNKNIFIIYKILFYHF